MEVFCHLGVFHKYQTSYHIKYCHLWAFFSEAAVVKTRLKITGVQVNVKLSV